jgi:hypothetical protein
MAATAAGLLLAVTSQMAASTSQDGSYAEADSFIIAGLFATVVGTAGLEGLTGQLDNLVLPLWYMASLASLVL